MLFLSYRRDDSAETVGRINDYLVRAFPRWRIFQDVDSIPAGVRFIDHVKAQLRECSVFIPVIGPGWAGPLPGAGRRFDDPDDLVRIEVEIALLLKVCILPVYVQNAPVLRSADLPESLQDLTTWQGIRIRPDPDFRRDIKLLVAELRRCRRRRLLRPATIASTVCSLALAAFLVCYLTMEASAPRLAAFMGREATKTRWETIRGWITPRQNEHAVGEVSGSGDQPLGPAEAEPAKAPHTAWVFLGYYDTGRSRFVEGPFARVVFRPGEGERGEIVPQLGDILKLSGSRQLVIADYRSHGGQNEFVAPPLVHDILTEEDETGRTLPIGALVLVRDVDIGGHLGRPASVWCRVAECEPDNPACAKALRELVER